MLDLFEKVEVKKVDRLEKADLEAMKKLQSAFDKAKEVYNKMAAIVDDIVDEDVTEYLNHTSLKDEIRERLQNATKSYIENIYWYFKQEYKIGLKNNIYNEDIFRWKYTNRGHAWEEAMEYVNSLHYEKIIDDIYSQTGTLNFKSKGTEEFLEKCRKDIGYKMEHKNNSVSFRGLVWQNSWNQNEISYSCDENLKMMFCAINYFENQNYSLSSWASNFCTLCRSNSIKDSFNTFSTHTNVPFRDIEHIKLYKNGKVELKFSSYEVAEKFYSMFYRE